MFGVFEADFLLSLQNNAIKRSASKERKMRCLPTIVHFKSGGERHKNRGEKMTLAPVFISRYPPVPIGTGGIFCMSDSMICGILFR